MIIESESTCGAVCKGMDGEVSRQLFGATFNKIRLATIPSNLALKKILRAKNAQHYNCVLFEL